MNYLYNFNFTLSHKLELRLTCIKLAGFKSFVDPTTIPVSSNLIGVVGPNGCGKSNVIDAVRWVLGESKASALRGDSIQDVIFAGSNNRKAIGRASVEIIFDNELKRAPGQWLNYAEIAIKRVLQRDGISSYYINNIQVRRRDIFDLFLGTGIGGHGYAIIEQGMLSRIIEAKPVELKGFLEEAAGISQYRERRQETSTRLMESRKNLTRLADIQQELIIQLQHLELQAEAAERYQTYQHEMHMAQSLLWLHKRNDALQQRNVAANAILKLEAELEQVFSAQSNAEVEFQHYRELQNLANDRLQLAQQDAYTVNARIGRIEQEIKYLRDHKHRLQDQNTELENQLEKSSQLKADTLKEQQFWHQEREKTRLAIDENARRQENEYNTLPELEKAVLKQQEQSNQCQQDLIIVEQSNRLENTQLAHCGKNIQQLKVRHTRLLNEQSQLLQVDSAKLNELQSKIKQIELALEKDNLAQQNRVQQLTAVTHQKQEASHSIRESQDALSQATARFKAINNLQQKLQNANHSDAWFRRNQLDRVPKLWQKISIPVEWESALESVMREKLNSIELEKLDHFQNCIDDAPNSKWIVYEKSGNALYTQPCLEDNTVHHSVNFKKLLTLINTKEPEILSVLQEWLNHAYVIENIELGFQQRGYLTHGEILVTPQGHIFTQSSFFFYAPDSELHGVLSRQHELEETRQEMNRLESLVNQQKDALQLIENDFAKLSSALESTMGERKQNEKNKHDLELELAKFSQLNEQFLHRNQQIDSELLEIKQSLEQEYELQQLTEAKLEEASEQIQALKERVEQYQRTWEASNQLLTEQRKKLHEMSQQSQQAVLYANTCDNKINEMNNKLTSIEENLQQLADTQLRLNDEIHALNEDNLHQQLNALQSQRTSTEHALSVARQEIETIMHHLRETENTRLACEHQTHKIKDEINQIRLKEQAATISIEQLDELISNAKESVEELTLLANKKNIPALQSEINRLNANIAALGTVNLASLEELANARSREFNLTSQIADLNEAIATLESVIQKIDTETESRLKETFNQVNQYLGEIFPIIFSGGKAKLELNNDQILDAGLVLTAQPPGKKNSSIHLLSGGEKALTALALIFALFRLNPAPFCLLDEVDAPLDDRNTERFCELVKKMALQTQFLFISHNKITMEMAQQLIGVTMQEQGVSKIVAVDIADAIKIGRQIKQPNLV